MQQGRHSYIGELFPIIEGKNNIFYPETMKKHFRKRNKIYISCESVCG